MVLIDPDLQLLAKSLPKTEARTLAMDQAQATAATRPSRKISPVNENLDNLNNWKALMPTSRYIIENEWIIS